MRNHRTQLLLVVMLAGMVLWLTSPGGSGASANDSWWDTLSDDTRYYAVLSGPALGGVTLGGVAEYREESSRRRLEVSMSSVNLASGTSLSVRVNGNAVGNMTVDSFANAFLSLDTNNGNAVPVTAVGNAIQVLQSSTAIASGAFSATPPPSPSPGASPGPSPGGSPGATPSPSGSPGATPGPNPSPGGSPGATPSPSPGACIELEASLSGSPINGVRPDGSGQYETCGIPGAGDFKVRLEDVNLMTGASLQVYLNGSLMGSMQVRSSGRAEFRLYYGAAPLVTPGMTVDVRQGSNTIASGVFQGNPNPSPSPSGSPGATPTPSLGNCAMSFSAGSYDKNENGSSVTLTVNRNCSQAGASSVDLETAPGTASDRADFIQSSTRISFAEGETSKTVNVILVNDNYVEGAENFSVTLENAVGGIVSGDSQATVNIADDDTGAPTANPFEAAEFFVRQHYSDFLSREPDAGGLAYWTNQVTQCGTDEACIRARRIGVSAAFFIELEFQDTGSFIYRLYRASYNRRPVFAEFAPDRARIVGGADLAQNKLNFSNEWVTRPAFKAEYPDALTPELFVNRLFDNAGLVGFADERQAQINAMRSGRPRAEVLRQMIEINAFKQREFNPSFVLMQYFGYLRRDPDTDGYDFWLNILNQQPQNARGMVCAFITSAEMQLRFSSVTPRTNGECGGNP